MKNILIAFALIVVIGLPIFLELHQAVRLCGIIGFILYKK